MNTHQWWSLVRVAETLSALTIISFFLSVTLNSYVFWQWGLNFVQIASPEDIIMSGISTLYLTGIAFSSSSVFFWFGNLLIKKFFKTHMYLYPIFILAIEASISVLIFSFEELIGRYKFVFTTVIFATFGLIIPSYKLFNSKRLRFSIIIILMIASGILLGSVLASNVRILSQNGYQDKEILVNIRIDNIVCQGRVIWMGSRSILATCSGPLRLDTIFVLPEDTPIYRTSVIND